MWVFVCLLLFLYLLHFCFIFQCCSFCHPIALFAIVIVIYLWFFYLLLVGKTDTHTHNHTYKCTLIDAQIHAQMLYTNSYRIERKSKVICGLVLSAVTFQFPFIEHIFIVVCFVIELSLRHHTFIISYFFSYQPHWLHAVHWIIQYTYKHISICLYVYWIMEMTFHPFFQ